MVKEKKRAECKWTTGVASILGSSLKELKKTPTKERLAIIKRPKSCQPLCADKGYSGAPAQQAIQERKYVPHVRQRGQEIQEKKTNPRFKARRWVVEVAHSWFNRFRKLLVRYEKLTETHEALLQMAAAIIAFRKTRVIYG